VQGWRVEPARDADAPRLAELVALLSARAPAPRIDATWVARGEAAVPVGYLEARRAGDVLEILALAVDPRERRRGVASALVEGQLAQAARLGLAGVHLEVRASNAEARALYAGLGFAEVGRRARYYVDGEDAVLLERSLSARAAVA
jgi:ribosomal protein S18 acetylase RimI-like enzyme